MRRTSNNDPDVLPSWMKDSNPQSHEAWGYIWALVALVLFWLFITTMGSLEVDHNERRSTHTMGSF